MSLSRSRDTDNDGTDDDTLTSDKVGNQSDDGEHSEYVWDSAPEGPGHDRPEPGRPIPYHGLGYRTGWHDDVDVAGDVDADGDVDTSDKTQSPLRTS